MSKQEVIQGLEKLKEETIRGFGHIPYPYSEEFDRDIEVLTRAIEIIEKCMVEKGTTHENLIELVYPGEE